MDLHRLYKIADDNCIDIDYFPLRQALSVATPDSIAIDVDKIETLSEEKAVLGHELGHCMTDAFYRINTFETRGRMEARANRWAIKNLIPWPELQEAVCAGITESWNLAEYFDLPEWFIKETVAHYLNACGKSFNIE